MNNELGILNDEELDTIGEVMNISMGAAATAVSTMLDKRVTITTPQITQDRFMKIDYSDLDPAIVVKIKYIKGLQGTNAIMLRVQDMKVIVDLLMGNEVNEDDPSNFEFDDMSMSAACEVMNQMMGSSSTALSEMLNTQVNISTPEAMVFNSTQSAKSAFDEINQNDEVVSIKFKMKIQDSLDTSFMCIMPFNMTKKIINTLNNGGDELEEVYMDTPNISAISEQETQQKENQQNKESENKQEPSQQPKQKTQVQEQQPQTGEQDQPTMQQPQQQAMQQPQPGEQFPNQQPMQQMSPNANNQQMPPFQQPVDPAYNTYSQQTPYGQQYMQPQYAVPPYPGYPYQMPYQQNPSQFNVRYAQQQVNIQQPDFPDFNSSSDNEIKPYDTNLNMLMGVKLDVSVVVGRTKQKIKDVLEFGQGTVLELDTQTGSPAEIIVNGKLLAYGDIVVVGDNFGVRVTEIVGIKELLESIDSKK